MKILKLQQNIIPNTDFLHVFWKFLSHHMILMLWYVLQHFQCSDKLGLSLELGSFVAGVMISTTDFAQHTLDQVNQGHWYYSIHIDVFITIAQINFIYYSFFLFINFMTFLFSIYLLKFFGDSSLFLNFKFSSFQFVNFI